MFSKLTVVSILLLAASPALAHTVTYEADLNGDNVVNSDGSMGSGSSATGSIVMTGDEHELVFDVLSFNVEGIMVGDLDLAHGPNNTAIHVYVGSPNPTKRGSVIDPMVIDLGWYISAGFGSLTPTAGGFQITVSGIVTEMQGAYDMTGTTGLTPEDVFVELEEGNCYVQIHTLQHPDGDIRGQLLLPPIVPNAAASFGGMKAKFQGQ